jgi:alpha-tubulin suppressor-like RCC1 family protein
MWAAAALLVAGCGFKKVASTPPCYAYIVASDSHTCARRTDGTLRCWGNNQYGQLGLGEDTSPRSTPTEVPDLAGATGAVYVPTGIGMISSRTASTCARKRDGTLWCWGNNQYGQLGLGDTAIRLRPTQVDPERIGNGAHIVSGGAGFTCTQKTDFTLWCWGSNDYGQLGTGDSTPSLVPVQVDPQALGSEVDLVYTGASHTCAVKKDLTLWCWGRNQYGQLGLGDTRSRNRPTQVIVGLGSGVLLAFAGAEHTCAVKSDMTLWCWGNNQYGQLGTGDTSLRTGPTPISFADLTDNVSLVTAGGSHTCAAKTDGSLWCWGNNQYGQLGTGDRQPSPRPVPVDTSGLGGGVEVVYAGGNHTCARTGTNELWCWGNNQYGQLGVEGGGDRTAPEKVAEACP